MITEVKLIMYYALNCDQMELEINNLITQGYQPEGDLISYTTSNIPYLLQKMTKGETK